MGKADVCRTWMMVLSITCYIGFAAIAIGADEEMKEPSSSQSVTNLRNTMDDLKQTRFGLRNLQTSIQNQLKEAEKSAVMLDGLKKNIDEAQKHIAGVSSDPIAPAEKSRRITEIVDKEFTSLIQPGLGYNQYPFDYLIPFGKKQEYPVDAIAGEVLELLENGGGMHPAI